MNEEDKLYWKTMGKHILLTAVGQHEQAKALIESYKKNTETIPPLENEA